jgi:photosystem II stability/assembly factor-like uncharacterized protein
MITCLSPNGSTTLTGATLADRLAVATAEGVVVAERRGEDWTVISHLLRDRHISSLAYDLATNSLFACSYDGGVFASSDNGMSFEARADAPNGRQAFTIAAVHVGGKLRLYLGTEPVGLFVSSDEAASWSELEAIAGLRSESWTFPPPPHEAHLKSIAADPAGENSLYACVEQGGLFHSDDGGTTFVELSNVAMPDDASGKDIHRVVIDPSRPDRLYCTGGDGVVFSDDHGETWTRIHSRSYAIGYPDALVVDPRDPARLFLAGASEGPGRWRESHTANAHVAISSDGGASWHLSDAGLPNPLRANIEAMSFACTGSASSLVFGTTDGDIYESNDEGGHWHLGLTGLAPISKGGHFRVLSVA